jgi:hypothetical protein
VLTKSGVTKVAAMLRQRRQQAQEEPLPVEAADSLISEKKEEGGGAVASVAGPVMAMALRSRNLPNRKRLSCLVEGREDMVLVRDTAFYRQGEQFEVRQNDFGEWEAAVHRTQPKYR